MRGTPKVTICVCRRSVRSPVRDEASCAEDEQDDAESQGEDRPGQQGRLNGSGSRQLDAVWAMPRRSMDSKLMNSAAGHAQKDQDGFEDEPAHPNDHTPRSGPTEQPTISAPVTPGTIASGKPG